MDEIEKKARAKVKDVAKDSPISAQDYAKLSPIEKAVAETEIDMERSRKLFPKKFR